MAETVRQQALSVQQHADAEAREVAAAASRAAFRWPHLSVLPATRLLPAHEDFCPCAQVSSR